ncbi:putative Abl interactor 1 [Hypsibius exemplaris]|uniref:Abl interactor 1 n=1 Tax=Hypsibius exemplaris TaxID=2072580 RepID=A0A1W0X8E3_HYPEX|nr:putative Abl interactor 1 [Hypsibius exemplaris]
MAEQSILGILEQDIPEAHQNLRDSHGNLEKVANYCRQNYLQAVDKRSALEETKNYAIQALASVAYQINAFSYHLGQLFDHQDVQVSEMEGQVRHIGQTVMVHKEKIARREIGALATTNKSMHRSPKVLPPPSPERAIRYTRRPVDYAIYDDLGHGMKLSQPHHGRNGRKGSSVTDGTSSVSSATGGGGPNTNYDTSAMYRKSGNVNPGMTGTLTRSQGRNMGDYRVPVPPPPPVVPPIVPPSHYGPGYISNGRQAHSNPSSRLSSQCQGDHYRTGNVASVLPGCPVPNGPLSPPFHNSSQQNSPLPPSSMQQQYGSHNEMFQYPLSSQPVRKLSSGSNHGNYGVMPHHGARQGSTGLPPPPPSAVTGENCNYRNGVTLNGNSNLLQSAGVKTPVRNSTMLARLATQPDAANSPPLPPPPPPETVLVQHSSGNGNGYTVDGEPAWVPKAYLDKVVAIYDYQADKDDELTFMENQIIFVIKKNDDGWFEGVMEGVRGLFPGNYVESCI